MAGEQDSETERLRAVPFLTHCSAAELASIASSADEIRVLPGYVLAREGQPGRSFYVIATGRAAVSIGGNHIVSLGPGDFFGEMSILEDRPRVATVTAETPMVLMEFSVNDFLEMIRTMPGVAVNVMRTLSARLRAAETSPVYRTT